MSFTIFKRIPKGVPDAILVAGKWLWISAVVAFAAVFVYRKWDEVSGLLEQIPASSLLLAFGSMGVAKIFLTLNMQFTLRYEDVRLPFWEVFRIYNESQIAKYLPGGIWHFVGKAAMLKHRNLDFRRIKNVMFLELIWIVITSLLFGGSLLYFSAGSGLLTSVLENRIEPGLRLLILLMLVLIVMLIFRNRVASRLRFWLSQYALHLLLVFNGVFLWTCLGFSFFILCAPYNHDAHLSFSYLAGVFAIAYLIGFVFPLAPAGIGLRESVLVFGLAGIVDQDTAIVIAGVNRLIYVLVEIFLFFVCASAGHFAKKRHP